MSENSASIVLDIGSGYTKVGLSSDAAPISIFETIVGRPRKGLSEDLEGLLPHSAYVGPEAREKRTVLTLKKPVEHGIVTNWTDWEEVLRFCFNNRLCVDPCDFPVVLSQPTLNPRMNTEKMTQILFEESCVPALYIGSDAVFSFRSQIDASSTEEQNVGLLVDLSETGVQAVPIYHGRYLPFCVPRSTIGAVDVRYQFAKLVSTPEYPFETSVDLQMLQKPLEENIFVSQDFSGDKLRPDADFERTITLQNGKELVLGKSRFECMEILFKPFELGFEYPSIIDVMRDSISRCDPSIRSQMLSNVVLAGGMSGVPGLALRIEKELANSRARAHPHPTYSAWLGAQMMANSLTFESERMSKEDYDENGPAYAHRKFPCS